VKVATIIIMIVAGIGIIVWGIGNGGQPTGISNLWTYGGFFSNGWIGTVLALHMVMFAYGGIEIIGITAGEAKDPEKSIPRAINSVPLRILVFYVGTLFVIMSIYPWNQVGTEGSPFVMTFQHMGIGLTIIYLALFHLGSDSANLVDQNANGAAILHAYVAHTFGGGGSIFLAILIFLACLVTAVGLTCACAEFFSQYLPFSYRTLVFILGLFSMVVSNLGLDHLIKFSIPVLTAIYPPCIVLVLLSFTRPWWNNSSRIIAPAMLVSLVFGIIDGIKASAISSILPEKIDHLWLSDQGLAWLIPTLAIVVITIIWDKAAGAQVTSASH